MEKRTLPQVAEVPQEYAEIAQAILSHALGEGAEPEKSKALKEFYEWLFYEGADNGDNDFELVMQPDKYAFSDEELRARLDLADGCAISDNDRLKYARNVIKAYSGGSRGDVNFAEVFELHLNGKSAKFGYLSMLGGQGGNYPRCYGCFEDLPSFLDYLRGNGWWVLKEGDHGISDRDILAFWYSPPKLKGK